MFARISGVSIRLPRCASEPFALADLDQEHGYDLPARAGRGQPRSCRRAQGKPGLRPTLAINFRF